MGKRPGPLFVLRKLYRALYQLRNRRDRRRERSSFRLRFKSQQNALSEQAKNDWRGGYILQDDGSFVYVPAQLDITVLERLTRTPAPEPIISRVCPPGGTVIDVGANLADWTLPMAEAVGRPGRVYAFEPIDFLADAIRKTLKINGFPNSRVIQTALSDRQGEAPFTTVFDEDELLNIRCSGIVLDHLGGKTSTVPTTTLDAFVDSEKLDRLDFIKIDVEGHEKEVFRGSVETLRELQPAIVFETGLARETEEDRQAIHDALAPLGYSMTGILIEHGVVETDWTTYIGLSDPFMPGFHCNLLCLPPD